MAQSVGDLRLAVVFDDALRTAAVQIAQMQAAGAMQDGPRGTYVPNADTVRGALLSLSPATQSGLGAVHTAARGGFQGIGMGHTAAAVSQLAGTGLAAGESVVESVVGGLFGGLVSLKRAVSDGVAKAAESAAASSLSSAGSGTEPIRLYRREES